MSKNKQNNIYQKTLILTSVVALEGLAAAVWLLLIPKEAENAVILGYSLRRLALLLPLLLPPLIALIMRVGLRRENGWVARLLEEKARPKTAFWSVFSGLLLTVLIWSAILLMPILLPFIRSFPDMGAYVRLLPLLIYYLVIGLEVLSFVPLVLYPQIGESKEKAKKFPTGAFFAALAVILAALALVEITGLGKDPERVSIIVLGVPLLEGQIWYVIGLLVLGAAAAFSWVSIPKANRLDLGKHKDLLIAVFIWLAAVALWMSLPLPVHNYFAPSVRAPNYELFPFSDAEQYDFNSLYVYFGSLKNFVVSKPLYVSLLALLHAIGGLDYARIIFLQTLIIAFFPVVLYFIGRELHSRFGGIALAMLAIFREASAIQATNMANVSNTKLLLSDMLATLLVSLLVLALIRWFKYRDKKVSGHEFLIGGLLGALILTRIQTMVLVPFVMLLVVVHNWRKFKTTLYALLVLLAAVTLVVAPVIIRNHSITDVYWVDNPSSSRSLYTFFSDVGDNEIVVPEAGTNQEFLERNIAVISSIFINNFKDIALITMDNFMRNEISAMLVMPVRLGNGIALMDYLVMQQPFWTEVYSQPNLLNLLVLLANAGLIALGFAYSYKRFRGPLLVVLALHVVYSLSSAVVRLSGWRFIQPVDWIVYMLYAFGVVELIQWAFRRLAGWNLKSSAPWLMVDARPAPKRPLAWPVYAVSGLFFFFIGALIPAREHLLPSGVPQENGEQICQTINEALLESDYENLSADFMAFCRAEDTLALTGIGVYPRYFNEDEGYYQRTYDPWFGQQDYARLTFRSIGNPNEKIYIKTDKTSIRFSNGAQIWAVGRLNKKFEAQFVLIAGDEPQLIISEPVLSGEDQLVLVVDEQE